MAGYPAGKAERRGGETNLRTFGNFILPVMGFRAQLQQFDQRRVVRAQKISNFSLDGRYV